MTVAVDKLEKQYEDACCKACHRPVLHQAAGMMWCRNCNKPVGFSEVIILRRSPGNKKKEIL